MRTAPCAKMADDIYLKNYSLLFHCQEGAGWLIKGKDRYKYFYAGLTYSIF